MAQQPDISIAGAPVVDLSEFDGAAFDLDGVITRTATVHAAAWKQLFDTFLEHRTVRAGENLQPFDVDADYPRYVDGRPRYDGVRRRQLAESPR